MEYTYSHIHLTTQTVDEWGQWYVDTMGATITGSSEAPRTKIVNLDVGGVAIRISNLTGVERYIQDETGKKVLPPEGYHHLGFLVDDIDACVAELLSKGAVMEAGVRQPSSAMRNAFLKLPGGVRIELGQKSL